MREDQFGILFVLAFRQFFSERKKENGSLSTVVGRCQLTSREDQLGLLFFDV